MFKVISWNVNSIRTRFEHVVDLLDLESPDVLCLQEIKAQEGQFSTQEFEERGYHVVMRGEKGYSGVMTMSRVPIDRVRSHDFCARDEARHLMVRLRNGIEVENFYVPAGGDEPDPVANPKFQHKLSFLEEMGEVFGGWSAAARRRPRILVGDLNVAPLECDVWSHVKLRNVVSHTEPEIERLAAGMAAGGWTDVVRQHTPPPAKLYTWWSYRARDWAASDYGRRLDHIWASPGACGAFRRAYVRKDMRGREKPSDHAPVVAEFDD